MANQEHLDRLKQGVDAWNKWRTEVQSKTPWPKPDLAGADLSETNLRGVNFWRANLNGVNLSSTDLFQANISSAYLTRADLSNANLLAADLTNTELVGADLRFARLEEANLSDTNLSEADLTRANLMGASLLHTEVSGSEFAEVLLGETIFANNDLSNTRSLNLCRHHGPSSLDYLTLQYSRNLPKEFLRGCGLPDRLIEYYDSLLLEPFEWYSCFISYSSQDDAFAERLHTELDAKGVRNWFAPEDLKIGDKIRPRIDEAIKIHDKLLIILSENSLSSDWVENEVESALEQEQRRGEPVLFPIRLDDAVMETDKAWAATIRRTRHIGDFTKWKDHDAFAKAFERLMRDLGKGEDWPY